MMPASDFTTEFTAEFNSQLAEYEGVVDSLCAPACAEESLPDLVTKVEACVTSLTNWTHMQCSPACTDMLSAVQSSACYTSQSFSSSIPAEMWTTMTQACQLFDTCYEEQMTYQTIVPQCQMELSQRMNGLPAYDQAFPTHDLDAFLTTAGTFAGAGCFGPCKQYVEMAMGDNSCTRGQLALMPASDFKTEYTQMYNDQIATAEAAVEAFCAPACVNESLPDLATKVEACAMSLTNLTHMQCSPACTDLLSAVEASSCYTSQSFSSSIPAEMWTIMTQACQLFDTCYEEQMTYQTIVPQCESELTSYNGGWCVAASHSAPHPAHPTPGPTLTPLPLPSRSRVG